MMGRFNKTIDGVFVDIVGTPTEMSKYEKFINYDNSRRGNPELRDMVKRYRAEIKKGQTLFERLARLEEIIMQLRSAENLDNIKLSVVKDYVYARIPFYRIGKVSKDIRVIVDKLEFWNKSEAELLQDAKFMALAEKRLIEAMDKEIDKNIEKLRRIEK